MSPQQQIEALASADTAVRLSALRSIVEDPAAAIEAGGSPLIEALLGLGQREDNRAVRRVLVAVLACCHGPAVTAFLLDEMQRCDDELALDLGQRLSTEPLAHVGVLGVLMFDAEREAVRFAAALALQAVDGMPEAIQLRRDLQLDRDGEWVLFHEAPEAWAEELAGPLAARAWRRVDRPLPLWEQWSGLDEPTRRRLVRWTAQQAPSDLVACLAALPPTDVSDAVAVEALERGREAGLDGRDDWLEVVLRFAGRPALAVRAAVIASGGLDDHLPGLAVQVNEDPALRVAALRRWAAVAGAEAEPALRDALQDAQWAVRAAAGRLLGA